ncbi:MAG TPA: hypothetical protein VGE52_22285 [Pirellulales bacterium]
MATTTKRPKQAPLPPDRNQCRAIKLPRDAACSTCRNRGGLNVLEWKRPEAGVVSALVACRCCHGESRLEFSPDRPTTPPLPTRQRGRGDHDDIAAAN